MAQPRFLIDTNVVIGLLNGDAESIALIQSTNSDLAHMAISQITRMELLGFAGMNEADERTLQSLVAAVHVVMLDAAVESQTIALRRQRKIKLPDAIIAATAIAHGLKLLTLDKTLLSALNTPNPGQN